MRHIKLIVPFLLTLMIIVSGGCINGPEAEKTKSPVMGTDQENISERISETTSPLDGSGATFPSGTFEPGSLDWLSYSPKDAVLSVLSRISEKYNVTEGNVTVIQPSGSLASFTGTADGIEFGLFAYPNRTAVEDALRSVNGELRRGFRQVKGAFWEKGNDTYTVYYTYERYFYLLFVAKVTGGSEEERIARLSKFAWSIIVIGPSPGKILGLFLPVKLEENDWTEKLGLRFKDYLDARQGTVEGTNVSAVFLVYRPYEGREVYLQLKGAFLENGWVERKYVNTYTQNPAGHLVASDYFEANSSGVYIELADVAGVERVTLLFGDDDEVKEIVRKLWACDNPTKGLSVENGSLPRGTFRPVSERDIGSGTVIAIVLNDLRKEFNIITDFVNIPEIPASARYTGKIGDVEFMLLIYPNETAYLIALDELTEKLLAKGWERSDNRTEPYLRTFVRDSEVIKAFVQYRYNHYLMIVVREPRYSTSDFLWHAIDTGGTSPEELLSSGKLRDDVKPLNWTAGMRLRFDGYIRKLEGKIHPGGARAVVLFYPRNLGREVYLQLKRAFLETKWVEGDYIELPTHDGKRHLQVNDLFDNGRKATYIEISTYGDMEVLILLHGNKSEVKTSARTIWE